MSAVSDNDIERMIRGLTIMGGQILPDGQGYVVGSAIAMLQSLLDERRRLKSERDPARSRAESLADQVRRDYEQIASVLAELDALAQNTARLRAKLDISRELLRGIAGVRDCCDLDAFEAAEETRRQIDAALAGREGE